MGKPSFSGHYAGHFGGRTVAEIAWWFADERFNRRVAQAAIRLDEWLHSENADDFFRKEMNWRHDQLIKARYREREELRKRFPWDRLARIYQQYKRR